MCVHVSNCEGAAGMGSRVGADINMMAGLRRNIVRTSIGLQLRCYFVCSFVFLNIVIKL